MAGEIFPRRGLDSAWWGCFSFPDCVGAPHGGDYPSIADAGQRGLFAARVGLLLSRPWWAAARRAGGTGAGDQRICGSAAESAPERVGGFGLVALCYFFHGRACACLRPRASP